MRGSGEWRGMSAGLELLAEPPAAVHRQTARYSWTNWQHIFKLPRITSNNWTRGLFSTARANRPCRSYGKGKLLAWVQNLFSTARHLEGQQIFFPRLPQKTRCHMSHLFVQSSSCTIWQHTATDREQDFCFMLSASSGNWTNISHD